ncbi:MAG TPA: DUF268 domain-containing protein [Solirubrobacteraceae bacterium]|nr:DUF268 domain-containing protein [Solirubrobacteraceae bacterium]
MASEANSPWRERVRRALGWPARRLLDPRARWIAGLVTEQVDQRVDQRAEELGRRVEGLKPKLSPLRIEALIGTSGRPEHISEELARFLNWTESHEGYAAQAGLWFNPAVPVAYRTGGVDVRLVNERIVEQPFVFGALQSLPPSARLLDVGGSESTLALSFATLGYEVTVVDPRGYPLTHPALRSVSSSLDQLDADDDGYDAAIALSSVEHFGLGPYGTSLTDQRLDVDALVELRRRVRPGGLLILTVPLGEPAIDHFERVYDKRGLDELLGGWRLVTASAAWRTDGVTWIAGELERPLSERGVALVVASNGDPA